MTRPRPTRVLVTGASGFLGTQVCASLTARDIPVRALVRRGRAAVPPGTEAATVGGLDDAAGVRRALADVTCVIHLAAHVHQPRAAADEAAFRAVNVDGTRALLAAALAAGVRDFAFASTVKAVGEGGEEVWTEETPPAPADAYGRTKLEAEAAVRAAARSHGLHAPILRLPLVYGPGMRANALRLFDLVDRGVPLPLGRVRNRRSVLFLGNFVAALEAVLGHEAGNDLFFVSDGPAVSTPELVRAIAGALGRPARLVPVPVSLMRTVARGGDLVARAVPFPLTSANLDRLVGSLSVDASKLERAVGFHPPHSLEAGLALTARWYAARRHS